MKPHALVVDDEEIIRRVLQSFLTRLGFRVTTATSSTEVARQLSTDSFELVILDADLGGEYAMGLLPTIRAAAPAAPVIIYSGVGADAELADLARARGAFAFVSKADPIEALGAVIQRAVPAANGASRAENRATANGATATKLARTAPATRTARASRPVLAARR